MNSIVMPMLMSDALKMNIVAAKKKEEEKTIIATKEISMADLQLHQYAVFGRVSCIC